VSVFGGDRVVGSGGGGVCVCVHLFVCVLGG